MLIICQQYLTQYAKEEQIKGKVLKICLPTAVWALGAKLNGNTLSITNKIDTPLRFQKTVLQPGETAEFNIDDGAVNVYNTELQKKKEAVLDSKIITTGAELRKAVKITKLKYGKNAVVVPNATIKAIAECAPIKETDDLPVLVEPGNITYGVENPFEVDIAMVEADEDGGLIYCTRLWPGTTAQVKFFGELCKYATQQIEEGNKVSESSA